MSGVESARFRQIEDFELENLHLARERSLPSAIRGRALSLGELRLDPASVRLDTVPFCGALRSCCIECASQRSAQYDS